MISILCPTRGRPDRVRRLIDSALGLADKPPELVFWVDEDDPDRVRYPIDHPETRWLVGPRIVLSEMWNRCAEVASHDVMMHCGDDLVFETPGWDSLVLEAFDEYPDRIVLVHGDDGSPHQGDFGTHGFLHRRWVDAVGYFVPPYFSCDWNDTWLNEVANLLGRRRYLPELTTHHYHPIWGSRPWDETDMERLARGQRDDVRALYAAKYVERQQDAAVLRKLMTS